MFVICVEFLFTHTGALMYLHELIFAKFTEIYWI